MLKKKPNCSRRRIYIYLAGFIDHALQNSQRQRGNQEAYDRIKFSQIVYKGGCSNENQYKTSPWMLVEWLRMHGLWNSIASHSGIDRRCNFSCDFNYLKEGVS